MFTVSKKEDSTGKVVSTKSFEDRESAIKYYYNMLTVAVAGQDRIEMGSIDLYWPTR